MLTWLQASQVKVKVKVKLTNLDDDTKPVRWVRIEASAEGPSPSSFEWNTRVELVNEYSCDFCPNSV